MVFDKLYSHKLFDKLSDHELTGYTDIEGDCRVSLHAGNAVGCLETFALLDRYPIVNIFRDRTITTIGTELFSLVVEEGGQVKIKSITDLPGQWPGPWRSPNMGKDPIILLKLNMWNEQAPGLVEEIRGN